MSEQPPWEVVPDTTERRVVRILGTHLGQAEVDNAFLLARLQEVAEMVQALMNQGVASPQEGYTEVPTALIARLHQILSP